MVPQSALPRRALGRTGLLASILGFGTAPLGDLFCISTIRRRLRPRRARSNSASICSTLHLTTATACPSIAAEPR
jgi:hypothetical protein